MCEVNAYLIRDSKDELLMESVDIIRPDGDGIYLENIFGERLEIKAHVKEMNFVDHRIVLVED